MKYQQGGAKQGRKEKKHIADWIVTIYGSTERVANWGANAIEHEEDHVKSLKSWKSRIARKMEFHALAQILYERRVQTS